MSSKKTTDVATDSLKTLLKYGILAVLVFVPFYAISTVWLASLGLNYDKVRLAKDFGLLLLVVVALILVIKNRKFSKWFSDDNLVRLILLFLSLLLLNALVVLINNSVSARAVGFGLIVDSRMLLFLLVVAVGIKSGLVLRIPRYVVIPGVIVIGFGLMQMSILSPDFLTHFGYGPSTIDAYQAVDNNPDYPRAQSTLRGPNPLGAYLIPIIMLLVVGAFRFKKYKWQFIVAIVAGLTLLVGTHSRSAWIGTALAMGLFFGWQLKGRARKISLVVVAISILVLGTGIYALRDNDVVQNLVFHSSEKSPSAISSNEQRTNALTNGLKDIASNPLGTGVGSAGPASVHNYGVIRQSENFYIQIGQELGLIGLVLYVAITALMIYRLWTQRNNLVVQAILAAYIGLILVNMLSHAWSDDTLAYVFGGLLGYGLFAYKSGTKPKHQLE